MWFIVSFISRPRLGSSWPWLPYRHFWHLIHSDAGGFGSAAAPRRTACPAFHRSALLSRSPRQRTVSQQYTVCRSVSSWKHTALASRKTKPWVWDGTSRNISVAVAIVNEITDLLYNRILNHIFLMTWRDSPWCHVMWDQCVSTFMLATHAVCQPVWA